MKKLYLTISKLNNEIEYLKYFFTFVDDKIKDYTISKSNSNKEREFNNNLYYRANEELSNYQIRKLVEKQQIIRRDLLENEIKISKLRKLESYASQNMIHFFEELYYEEFAK